jgi:hypothetical protein
MAVGRQFSFAIPVLTSIKNIFQRSKGDPIWIRCDCTRHPFSYLFSQQLACRKI